MTLIQYDQGKFWLLENYPKIGFDAAHYVSAKMEYEGAVLECVAARKEIVNIKIANLPINIQNGVWLRFDGRCPALIQEGNTFPLPDNLEFEKYLTEGDGFGVELVIRLKLKQEVKEERQDDLWDYILNYCEAHYINDIRVLEHLKSKFEIKRK